MATKTQKIDFSRKRLSSQADKYYNEGKYLSALRFAHKELAIYGGDGDVYTRLSDIYEGMGLHVSAINYWYKFLDDANEEDLPDIYEGLAVNYLNIGNETQSAFYYNKLMEVDDDISPEMRADIINAFTPEKKSPFRFVYPPQLADYSKELETGAKAMKSGDFVKAINSLSRIEKGAAQYAGAQETLAVAYLLADDKKKAEEVCLAALADEPENMRLLATLAAIYLELDKRDESREIALRLYAMEQDNADDLYKVATVCCENELHLQAYEKFCLLEKKIPHDGRMLYFKGVSAYKCGKKKQAEEAFDQLCTVYPDAEVARYYLRDLRAGGNAEPDYFYHVPQAERERRADLLLHISNADKEEAQALGMIADMDSIFVWAFDEMDGTDLELQYLALTAAVQAEADGFIRDALLDYEVADVLKVETLRMLLERNEEDEIGLVLCHIYRKVKLFPISVGRKRRKKFIQAYAKTASKFGIVCDDYARKVNRAAEKLYDELEKHEALNTVEDTDALACAIFLTSGIKEMKESAEKAALMFGAKLEKVQEILAAALGENKENKREID